MEQELGHTVRVGGGQTPNKVCFWLFLFYVLFFLLLLLFVY